VTVIEEVGSITYVGAGMMGCVNSLVAAGSGYDVVLHDRSADMLAAVADRHAEIGAFLTASGYCDEAGLTAALQRVSVEADLELSLAAADLISESIFEDRGIKRAVHADIDRLAPPDAIQTTNTSALMVSDIEDVVDRGAKFASLHSRLDLMHDSWQRPVGDPFRAALRQRVVPLLADHIEAGRLGQKSGAGFYSYPGPVYQTADFVGSEPVSSVASDALFAALVCSAVNVVANDVADPADVDMAWAAATGLPDSPFCPPGQPRPRRVHLDAARAGAVRTARPSGC
jgi:3-hydroxyacyl-CoA dehydrogenase